MTDSASRAILRALAAAQAEHPELARLLSFYQDLFTVQLAAKAQLPAREAPDPRLVQKRAEAGLPQLTFDELRLEATSFGALVARVGEVLACHNAEEPPTQGADLAILLPRARHVFESWPMLTPPPEGSRAGRAAAWDQALALALAPHLQHAAAALRPLLDQVGWGRPICAVCGGQPNLALLEMERGGRKLVCSRCDHVWDYTRVGCPYCRSQERQTYFLGNGTLYRLYVCPTCNRYLKTVDLRESGRPIMPTVERVLTVPMDLSAQQQGYLD